MSEKEKIKDERSEMIEREELDNSGAPSPKVPEVVIFTYEDIKGNKAFSYVQQIVNQIGQGKIKAEAVYDSSRFRPSKLAGVQIYFIDRFWKKQFRRVMFKYTSDGKYAFDCQKLKERVEELLKWKEADEKKAKEEQKKEEKREAKLQRLRKELGFDDFDYYLDYTSSSEEFTVKLSGLSEEQVRKIAKVVLRDEKSN
jgi:hypothetical protein